jgi:hypothetical protein
MVRRSDLHTPTTSLHTTRAGGKKQAVPTAWQQRRHDGGPPHEATTRDVTSRACTHHCTKHVPPRGRWCPCASLARRCCRPTPRYADLPTPQPGLPCAYYEPPSPNRTVATQPRPVTSSKRHAHVPISASAWAHRQCGHQKSPAGTLRRGNVPREHFRNSLESRSRSRSRTSSVAGLLRAPCLTRSRGASDPTQRQRHMTLYLSADIRGPLPHTYAHTQTHRRTQTHTRTHSLTHSHTHTLRMHTHAHMPVKDTHINRAPL